MTDFSVDYILNRAGNKYTGTNGSMAILERIKISIQNQRYHPYAQRMQQHFEQQQRLPAPQPHSAGFEEHMPQMYDWLQYTRYHPPKLPRSLGRIPTKRTPGRLPRIPFSPAQLQALENAYKESNYLSAEDANRLADSLELTNTRVKIWFQNRRARERREKRERDESCDSTFSSNASSPEPEMIEVA